MKETTHKIIPFFCSRKTYTNNSEAGEVRAEIPERRVSSLPLTNAVHIGIRLNKKTIPPESEPRAELPLTTGYRG